MQRYFITSLVYNGLIGGGITVNEEGVTYHTGKLTVEPRLRHLTLDFKGMERWESGWLLFLPTVTVTMKSGEAYRFFLLSPKRFIQVLEAGVKGA